MDNSAPEEIVSAEPVTLTVLVWVDPSQDRVGLITIEVSGGWVDVTGEAVIQGVESARQVLAIACAEPKVDLTSGRMYEGQQP